MKLNKIKSFIINLIYPKNIKCVVCEEELPSTVHYSICEKCLLNLPRNNKNTCLKCGEPLSGMGKYCVKCKNILPLFSRSFSPLLYEYPITKLIKEFKYDNKLFLSETLGNFLVESYVVNNLNCDIILPVPLHENRFKERGFNQSELLANQLKEKLNLNVDNSVLKRIKNTKTQTTLTRAERERNVEKAFVVENKHKIKGAKVLIIDDVYTTGSTLNECAKVLLKNGAKKVYCLTLAHTHRARNYNK